MVIASLWLCLWGCQDKTSSEPEPDDHHEESPTDSSAPGETGLSRDSATPGEDSDSASDSSDSQAAGDSAESSTLLSWTEEGSSDGRGLYEVLIELPEGARSFLVTGVGEEDVALEEIYSPDGERVLYWDDWWTSPYSLTSGFWPAAEGATVNWPAREEDGPLTAGSWRVVLSTYGMDYVPNVPITVSVHVRLEGDETGSVPAVLVYPKSMESESFLQTLDQATEHWISLWELAGLELDLRVQALKMDTDLPSLDALAGDSLAALQEAAAEEELLVLLGETIDGSSLYYGYAGDIPGPMARTQRGAVALSTLAHSGPNGEFDEEETRMLGETLAHELGHFLGVFHPVEDGYLAWDALADTEECSTMRSCEDALGDNVMFPYSICDWTSCQPVTWWSSEQSGVMRHYTATR